MFHVALKQVIILQVLLALLAFPVLNTNLVIKVPWKHEPSEAQPVLFYQTSMIPSYMTMPVHITTKEMMACLTLPVKHLCLDF